MTAVLYQECQARAQDMRDRLDRMRQWFDNGAENATDQELQWRRARYEEVEREYEELLTILRAYGKMPAGAESARGLDDLGFSFDSDGE